MKVLKTQCGGAWPGILPKKNGGNRKQKGTLKRGRKSRAHGGGEEEKDFLL